MLSRESDCIEMAARSADVDIEAFGINKQPHQPRKFLFPKREFGVTTVVKRSFQPCWFDKWPWLHYREDSDFVFCFTCMKAYSENKLQWSLNAESAFITVGFTNWKKASEKFSNHETSKCHKEAVLRMITLPATTQNIDECLSKEHQREKLERRQCLLKILSNIQFLARQGLPLRGHGSGIDSIAKTSSTGSVIDSIAKTSSTGWLAGQKNG